MRFGKPQQLPLGQRVNPAPREGAGNPNFRPGQAEKPLQPGPKPTHESQVAFDPVDGHQHDGGSGGTRIPHANLTDVGPDDHHARQHALLSPDHPDVDASTVPEDGDVLAFTAGKWKPRPAVNGGGVAPLQAWYRILSDAQTVKAEMPGSDGEFVGITMPLSGRIVGISADTNADFAGAGPSEWYEVELYRHSGAGVLPTGLKARVTENSGRSAFAAGSVAFAAGDWLTVYDERTIWLSGSPVRTRATLWIEFD